MAFKHPSFLEVVAANGIPFYYVGRHDQPIESYHIRQVVTVYHKPNSAGMDWPTHGLVGLGVANVWCQFIFPKPVELNAGTYIRVPKLDRVIMRQFEDARIQEMIRNGRKPKQVVAASNRIIDLGDT